MKAPAFDYVRPATLDDAVAALRGSDGDGRILAGGQSLLPVLNFRLARPSVLIDIGALEDLRAIRDDGGSVRFGALVTHARIEDGHGGAHWGGMLPFVARDIAYRAVRNRGTIGGSIAYADPAADWPVALTALGAEVEIVGPQGPRRVASDAFFLGLFSTALAPDEIVSAVRIPKLSPAARWSYVKVRRKAGAFAEALAALVVDPARNSARLVIGGSGTGARRLESVEDLLRSGGDAAGAIGAALESAAPELDDYHRHIQRAAVRRALERVVQ